MSEWLEVMPAIPLARGVPVVGPDGERATTLGDFVSMFMWVEHNRPIHNPVRIVPEDWRVDLDDPQGFRYAVCEYLLPWWVEHKPTAEAFHNVLQGACWMASLRTQALLLEVAEACAEVADGQA